MERTTASGVGGAESAPSHAILLLGHGSHLRGGSSRPVRELARRLGAGPGAPEVRVGFWKEEPELRDALLLVESPLVVAVPVFTSAGYFTERVVPRELGIEPPVSLTASGARLRYTAPVGAHPRMADVVLERAASAGPEGGASASDTTLVVLGHGTERHPASGEVVRGLVHGLAAAGGFADVRAAFLDEEPRMVPVLESVATSRAVVVPFFMAEGWHVGKTIPRELGLEDGLGRVGNTSVVFTEPVGTHPAVVRVVEAMVEEALRKEAPGGAPDPVGEPPARRARRAFLRWIDEAGGEGRTFLQTRVRKRRGGRYEIRHVADADGSPEALKRAADPHEAARIAEWTEDGAHRPLRTAPTLRSGWLLEELTGDEVWEAYLHLYPTAAVHWYLEREGGLPVVSYREAAGRQTGIYARVGELDRTQVKDVREACCGADRCLRRVRWPVEETDGPGGGGSLEGARPRSGGMGRPEGEARPGEGEVPCPEPCSIVVARARKVPKG